MDKRARGSGRSRAERAGQGGAESARGPSPELLWIVWLVPLVAGWLFILKTNHWHLGVSALILFVAWLGVLGTGVFLLQTGLSAVRAGAEDAREQVAPARRRSELQRERRALLKAIREIELDRQVGKLSDQDAARIQGFYRQRAERIAKVLDQSRDGAAEPGVPSLTPRQRIERDLAARLEEGAPGAGEEAKA